ncbi:MAG TPA: biotin--[acetyl-CoA-carboxylase] ligase [Bacteroidales bacterium]|nr:biotin--[acetyl-CoA-carboxylase] ligase [Bacteroidales bacterium]
MIIGSKIIYKDQLPSTNTYALELIDSGKPEEGTIICTDRQTTGRGQPGNSWESEPLKNLTFSLILYPEFIDPSCQFLVSMTISLGIRDFINKHAVFSSIKWPNDIYVNDDKIAGILIESSTMGGNIRFMIVGIGININQEEFRSQAPNPVSLKHVTGKTYDLPECLNDLTACIDSRYNELKEGRIEEIRKDYHRNLYRINKWTMFRDDSGEFTGRIQNVDDDGRLTIELKSGENRFYYFREVVFIP